MRAGRRRESLVHRLSQKAKVFAVEEDQKLEMPMAHRRTGQRIRSSKSFLRRTAGFDEFLELERCDSNLAAVWQQTKRSAQGRPLP